MKSRLKMPMLETVQYRRQENITEVQYFFMKVGDESKLRYLDSIHEYGVFAQKGLHGRDLVVLEYGDYIQRDLHGDYNVIPENMFDRNYERDDE